MFIGADCDQVSGKACFTCTGLFPMAHLWYLGEEMHCQRCYASKAGRYNMQEQGTQGDMVALIGAAVRETLKAASETSKDTRYRQRQQARGSPGDDNPTTSHEEWVD